MTAVSRRPCTAFLWVGLILPLLMLLAAAAVVAAWMPELPDPIATHWGAGGVDGFAPKWAYLPAVVGIGMGVVVFDAIIVLLAPRLAPSNGVPVSSVAYRAMGAINLGLAALIAVLTVGGAEVQKGLADAADAGNITGWLMVGLSAAVVALVLGWFLQPKGPAVDAVQATPAGSIPLATNERAAWFGTATMARIGVVVLLVGLATIAIATVFTLAAGEATGWILAAVTLFIAVTVCIMLVFRVRVNADGLVVRSIVGWPRTHIPLERVAKVETVLLDPLREFGGWGWRIAVDGRRGVVLRAGEALQVTRDDGRVFVVTVDGAADAAATLQTLRTHAETGSHYQHDSNGTNDRGESA